MFFNLALVITAASMVVYIYGLLSPLTAIAFFVISVCILSIAAQLLGLNILNKKQAIGSTEKRHFFSGYCFRTYTDAEGSLWLRDEDIRKRLKTVRPSIFMQRKYPQYFRKTNPLVDAWYLHHKVLRSMVGNHGGESDIPVIRFLEREVIGVHYGLRMLGGEKNDIPEPVTHNKRTWLIRFWHGEIGLITTIFVGVTLVWLAGATLDFLYPEEFVLHYQRTGITYLASLITTGALLFWGGHGIILATQHWIASGRSALMAFAAILFSLYLVTLSLDPFVNKYKQYNFAEWLSIAADSDKKASVYFDPALQATVINGPLGFGTTIRLLAALEKAPKSRMIALKSYGGRVAEGDAIYRIIKERKLDTYVWAECMSACIDVYIAGKNRYIAETAKFGLHRSGFHWDDRDNGPDEADLRLAELMRQAGVQEWLITRGMVPSIHGIYEPSAEDVLTANLATALYEP